MSLKGVDVGIVAIESYFPKSFVSQDNLETYLKVSPGKFEKGLGQLKMAFVDDREDVYSMSMTVLSRLIDRNSITFQDIGRLEVGSETILDHSKSIKSVLMQLFEESGNSDVEGVDTINACYGGTSALFNSIAWCQSEAWDGRYAVVVTSDIAEYAHGPALPTGGVGAVAMLIGPGGPLVLEKTRASHMQHAYDFYKPDLSSPFPVVDGHFSNECYLKSVDLCFQRFSQKFERTSREAFSLDDSDFIVFHSPYNKLVQKSFARLVFNEFMSNPDEPKFASVQAYRDIDPATTYSDRSLMNDFMAISKEDYLKKVDPSTYFPKNLGNAYSASLYLGLFSLISRAGESLAGKRILMFSYGSGLAATMFSFKVGDSDSAMDALKKMQKNALESQERIKSRHASSAEDFVKMTERRLEFKYGQEFRPSSKTELFPDTYYLTHVDTKGRRFYDIAKATIKS